MYALLSNTEKDPTGELVYRYFFNEMPDFSVLDTCMQYIFKSTKSMSKTDIVGLKITGLYVVLEEQKLAMLVQLVPGKPAQQHQNPLKNLLQQVQLYENHAMSGDIDMTGISGLVKNQSSSVFMGLDFAKGQKDQNSSMLTYDLSKLEKKMIAHASNYGMGAEKLNKLLVKNPQIEIDHGSSVLAQALKTLGDMSASVPIDSMLSLGVATALMTKHNSGVSPQTQNIPKPQKTSKVTYQNITQEKIYIKGQGYWPGQLLHIDSDPAMESVLTLAGFQKLHDPSKEDIVFDEGTFELLEQCGNKMLNKNKESTLTLLAKTLMLVAHKKVEQEYPTYLLEDGVVLPVIPPYEGVL